MLSTEEQRTKKQTHLCAERGREAFYTALILCICSLLYVSFAADITSSILYYERIGQKDGHDIEFRFIVASPGEEPLRNASMGLNYRCHIGAGNSNRTNVLPLELQECGLFDFATLVKSNKRILFIGDSVSQQLSEAFDESLGITNSWLHKNNDTSGRQVYGGYSEANKETISMSYPTNGGGASAYWRMTDIWTAENENKRLPPHPGGGWDQQQLKVLRNQLLTRHNRTHLDAIILNYNNWVLHEPDVMYSRYQDAIHLAQENFNTKAIILVTYPFTKTVNSTKRWNDVYEYNYILRRISAENNRNASSNALTLVLEFGNLTNQLLWTNARNIGVNVSDPRRVSHLPRWELQENVTAQFTNTPFCPMSAAVGNPCIHMPVVCAEYTDEKSDCQRNYISFDDMHWCVETIGARWSAGLACLLGCALNKCNDSKSLEYISICEKECNEQFMALTPLHQQLIRGDSWLSSCKRHFTLMNQNSTICQH